MRVIPWEQLIHPLADEFDMTEFEAAPWLDEMLDDLDVR